MEKNEFYNLEQIQEIAPIIKFIKNEQVTDILINGSKSVWVEDNSGLHQVAISLGNCQQIKNLATRLAILGGKRLDSAMPSVDVQLKSGVRMHAVLPPIAPNGPLISLRIFRNKSYELQDFLQNSSANTRVAQILSQMVTQKLNIFISGATGSGKTSLLCALLNLVPKNERIVCIEEAPEIQSTHLHCINMQSKLPNSEGKGEFSLSEVVKQSLRMRPNRIVLGECRGAEVQQVLMALNTGHQGSMATIHANSLQAVPARLVALGALAGLEPKTTSVLASNAINIVIHIARNYKEGTRFIQSIGVVDNSNHYNSKYLYTNKDSFNIKTIIWLKSEKQKTYSSSKLEFHEYGFLDLEIKKLLNYSNDNFNQNKIKARPFNTNPKKSVARVFNASKQGVTQSLNTNSKQGAARSLKSASNQVVAQPLNTASNQDPLSNSYAGENKKRSISNVKKEVKFEK